MVNKFVPSSVTPEDLRVPASEGMLQVIEALDGQLITNRLSVPPKVEGGAIVSDVKGRRAEAGGRQPLPESQAGGGFHQELRPQPRCDGVQRGPRFS